MLAPVLERFRGAHPSVDIMLHTGDQADGYSRVLEGQDDLAVQTGGPEPCEADLSLTGDGAGRWQIDGRDAPDLDGCLDLDIQVTPFTNSLPIRRLDLAARLAGFKRQGNKCKPRGKGCHNNRVKPVFCACYNELMPC